MLKNKSIAVYFMVFIFIPTSLILLALLAFDSLISSRFMFKANKAEIQSATLSKINTIETKIQPAKTLAIALAEVMNGFTSYDEDYLDFLLEKFVSSNVDVVGMSITFKPFEYNRNTGFKSLYCYQEATDNGHVYIKDRIGPQYMFMDWYQIPIESQTPHWSEPYIETRSQTLIVTYSQLFYKKTKNGRQIAGVVTADLSLDWLANIMKDIKITKSSYAVLLSPEGVFLTHPEPDMAMNESLFSQAELRGDPQLRSIAKKMTAGETGLETIKRDAYFQKAQMSYAPIALNNWSIGILTPQNEVFGDVVYMFVIAVVLTIVGVVLLFVTVFAVSHSLTKPITVLAGITKEIAKGNLDLKLPRLSSTREITLLTQSFQQMTTNLKAHIEQLTKTTAENERIESELYIARNIQQDMLPSVFPPYPDNPYFDIFAAIKPAKEVGGDLYDFYLIDENHLYFVIGDVSGKGVPASLFMAVTKTLLKAKSGPDISPEKIFQMVNDELAANNDNSMFVTLFLGVLNLETGVITYSNAGHNLPVIITKKGTVKFIEPLDGLVLGIMPGVSYKRAMLKLNPGDRLFLYTDGVPEAQSPNQNFFGNNKMISAIEKNINLPSKELTMAMLNDVDDFSKGEQADDITIMIIDFMKLKK